MHVIVVGCGRVGSSLALGLLDDGHSVAVIDRKAVAFARLGASYTGQIVEGIGFDRGRLIEAGVEQAGALAAVTSGDNSNILIARVARENFGIERVVARIYDPRRAVIYQRLGIPTVATVAWTTDQVLRRLIPDATPAQWTDPTAKVCLVERALADGWAGRPLVEVEEMTGVRVVAINRMGAATTPTVRTVAQAGDVLYVAVGADRLEAFDAVLRAGSSVASGGKGH
ncbi:MAG: TrkA family potassium uptake protein [Actinomycetota bacterium]|nr:TrkA family potassium uptake protein [Actinomycetota bacterium]